LIVRVGYSSARAIGDVANARQMTRSARHTPEALIS
jgi:hypothetical protein